MLHPTHQAHRVRTLLAIACLLLVPGTAHNPAHTTAHTTAHAAPPEGWESNSRALVPDAPTPPKPVKLPSSRAGDALRWVLDAINRQDLSQATTKCDPEFLKFIPLDEMTTYFKDLRDDAFDGQDAIVVRIMEGDRDDNIASVITTREAQRYLDVLLTVDDQTGLITSLRFSPSRGPGEAGGAAGSGASGGGSGGDARGEGDWDAFSQELEDLGGDIGFAAYELLQRDTNSSLSPWELMPLAAKDEDTPFAINAASMLYILGAVSEDVLAGQLSWDEALTIDEGLKSLPSGRMQLEPAGNSYPVSRFAQLMTSITDNTAADHLLHRLGRHRVETFTNAHNDLTTRNSPFLTTREFYNLKLSAAPDLLEQFVDADEPEKRAMLAPGGDVHALPLNLDGLREWDRPIAIHTINWFATPKQCAAIMAHLKGLEERDGMQPLRDALRANPGLGLSVDDWPTVCFKGGSEAGVQSGVWMLERSDSRWFVLVVIWNDRRVVLNNEKFIQVVYRGIDILANEGSSSPQPDADAPPATDAKSP